MMTTAGQTTADDDDDADSLDNSDLESNFSLEERDLGAELRAAQYAQRAMSGMGNKPKKTNQIVEAFRGVLQNQENKETRMQANWLNAKIKGSLNSVKEEADVERFLVDQIKYGGD